LNRLGLKAHGVAHTAQQVSGPERRTGSMPASAAVRIGLESCRPRHPGHGVEVTDIPHLVGQVRDA